MRAARASAASAWARSPDSLRQPAQARERRGLRVGVGHRRLGRRAVLVQDPAALRRGADRVGRVAPALLDEAAGRAPVPAQQAAAALQRAQQPVAGRAPVALELGGQRGVVGRRQHVQEERRRVGRAVVAQLAVGHLEPEVALARDGDPRAHLVDDLARLLVPRDVLARALDRGQRAQRGGRHVGARGQHGQRRDERVAPEQAVVAPRIALALRRAGGIRPAVGGQDLGEAGHVLHCWAP